MKKIFSVLFGSAFVVAAFTSCSNEEADIWNESSIERLEDTQNNYGSVFMSAENGWEMQYFPTAGSSGYSLALKFNDNGSVVAAMNNRWTDNQYKLSDPSTWKINIDNGPVLSFDSYNSVIHVFSDPKEIPGTSYSNGLGMEGDYEFIVITDLIENPDAEVITLKGKKRGTYAYLSRIPAGVEWEDHLDMINEMRNELVVNNPSPLALTVNGKEYNMWYNKGNDQLNIVELDGDTISMEKLFYYTFNSKGLYLLDPFNLDGAPDYQWFRTNQEEGQSWTDMTGLNAAEFLNGATIDGVTIAAGRPLWFFNQQLEPAFDNSPNSIGILNLDLSKDDNGNYLSVCPAFAQLLENVSNAITDVLAPQELVVKTVKYDLSGAYDSSDENMNGYSLRVNITLNDNITSFWIRFFFSHTVNDNSVTLAYNDNYRCSNSIYDKITGLILEDPAGAAAFDALFASLNSEFAVDFDKMTTLRTVKVYDVQNPDMWFLVKSTYYRK